MSAQSVIPADVVPLTDEHRKQISASAPLLAEHGRAITRKFYSTMIAENPSLRDVFSKSAQDTGHQADALAGALYAYAQNINDLSPLIPVVVRIAHKHAAHGITGEQYGIVGTYLIRTLCEYFGDAFTEELKVAWYNAYWQLAKIFIDQEAKLYAQAAWVGFQKFRVAKVEKESAVISSFYLEPVDGSLLPMKPFMPGQYLTVRIWVEEIGAYQLRHYSLSDAPNTSQYRISVKREPGLSTSSPSNTSHPGFVSNLLHEQLKEGSIIDAAQPYGDFLLSTSSTPTPVVFISAGVGVTPLLAMFNSLTGTSSSSDPTSGRKITWIQGSRNSAEQAFKGHVRGVAARSGGTVKAVFFHSRPGEGEVPFKEGSGEGDYDFEGRVDLEKVSREELCLGDEGAEYYVCGPTEFMANVAKKLGEMGVQSGRIHMEVFGSGGV